MDSSIFGHHTSFSVILMSAPLLKQTSAKISTKKNEKKYNESIRKMDLFLTI